MASPKGAWKHEDPERTYASPSWWQERIGRNVSFAHNRSFWGLLTVILWVVVDGFFIIEVASGGKWYYQLIALALTTEGIVTTPLTILRWAAKSGDAIYGEVNSLVREHFDCCGEHQKPFHVVAIAESGRLVRAYNQFLPFKNFAKETTDKNGKDTVLAHLCQRLAEVGKTLDKNLCAVDAFPTG
ncbi:MAG: hypothetical protein JRN08_05350 [Nitrososphaerota archaeon]|nr:hypothetical protein [Nitrososphaerota archaeon]